MHGPLPVPPSLLMSLSEQVGTPPSATPPSHTVLTPIVSRPSSLFPFKT